MLVGCAEQRAVPSVENHIQPEESQSQPEESQSQSGPDADLEAGCHDVSIAADDSARSQDENGQPAAPDDEGLAQLADSASGDDGPDDSGEFVEAMLARSKLEEQGLGTKGGSPPLAETESAGPPGSHRDEDVTAEAWRAHRKHVFVLSEAGKPIYSRYGSEEALSSTMGVMMALVSFVQSGDNIIRSVYSGKLTWQRAKVLRLRSGSLTC